MSERPLSEASNGRYSLDDLIYLMQRLRDPQDGCPWDLEQDFSTIVPFTIEETYELADAIERGDLNQVKDELGDVLFQVIFYSHLGKEQQAFEFEDVVHNIVAKLVRRHPHVFPAGTLASRKGEQDTEKEDVKVSWEAIKAGERKEKSQHSVLDDVPLALPALSRSAKLQKRAAKTGFDWEHVEDVIDKIKEEIDEVIEAHEQGDAKAIEHEVGDLLFACVNLARHLNVVPESALRKGNHRFEQRFKYIEDKLAQAGIQFEDASLDDMDTLWNQAKLEGL